MQKEKTIAILGAGAMGTALAVLIVKHKRGRVKLWDRDSKLINQIKRGRKNPKYFRSDVKIPKDVELSSNLAKTIEGSNLILLAVPSFALRTVCQKIAKYSLPPIMTTSKGIEKKTSFLPTQVVKDVLDKKNLLHLDWVGFVKEIKKIVPAKAVLVSENQGLLKEFKELFNFKARKYRFSTSKDLLGFQLAGALKNVMAIGIGMVNKENPEIKKRLIREGIREMIILGQKLGAKKETFLGPAGKEDLVISSDSLSRNFRLGQALVKKGLKKVKRDLKEKGGTVEGFPTAWAAYQLTKKYRLKLPLISEVYRAIYERKNPKVSAQTLRKLLKI